MPAAAGAGAVAPGSARPGGKSGTAVFGADGVEEVVLELRSLSSIPQIYRNLGRWREVITVLSKYGLARWLSRLDSEFAKDLIEAPDGEALARHSAEERFRMALTELGPTGIKLGQILSTRPDLVGVELANELERLQTSTPSMPAAQARHIVEDELGLPIEDLFAEFVDEPLASASIAQVHPARLHSGQHVAVKIQHPGVADKIRVDMEILAGLAYRAERFRDWRYFRPRETVAEIRRLLLRELDFGSEERNLLEFARRFHDDPSVRAPRPYTELSTGRVLTMEQLEGTRISERHRLVEQGLNLEDLARRGADLYLQMIFDHGVYHADPHPGNILILDGGVIGLVDFGVIGRIDERLREDAEELLLAIAERDDIRLTQILTRVGRVPSGLDEAALGADVADFVSRHAATPLPELEIGPVLNEMVELIRRYQITLPSRVSLLIKTMVVLEGTGKLLNPSFSLAEVIGPHQKRLMLRRFSPGRQLRKLRRLYGELEHLLDVLPRGLVDIMQQVRTGRFDVHLDHRGLEPSVNRLVLGLMCSALFLGSSLLLALDVPPLFRGISIPGAIGAAVSLAMGLRLLRAINKSGHLDGGRR